ncbi:uncharacterized protein LOC111714922 isoform X2 [Eurytemora carolleeae]|uniref:uncharacterized protein LOC111714922 isoform X2 n=1 Tax=Eurytemora carolleeae TaxID=1294199 RepID=UPI000C77DE5D|nr:uncharacterized protein LOC111714922 isoform X2 [Eurytemora carolleeae]|eukprot:XP_023345924.1 uncharacterized protein LOC111714922 isoform X2 [Eurytemora affinis]
MAANFQSLEEMKLYREMGFNNSAVLSECYTGGRILHWVPYKADNNNSNKVLKAEEFFHVYTNQSLAINAWRASQPNGKGSQCVKVYLSLESDKSWYDFPCEDPDLEWASCVACSIPYTLESSVLLTLRRLCPRSIFDTAYQVINDKDSGYISYIGDKATVIKYDSEQRLWIMKNVNNPTAMAVSNAGLETFVMGTHNWTIRDDIDCPEKEITTLTLSRCLNEEFTCSNGLCIDIKKRCNSRTDCRDKSDEVGCLRINPDKSYQKYISPQPQGNSSKIVIKVSADIMDILDIDEKSSIFQIQFYLHFSWYDSRLTFFDLRNDSGLNTLSIEEKGLIWIPVLVFDNTENKVTTLVDDEASITIQKQGDYYLSGLDEYSNREYYRGEENPLTLSRFYNTRFLCQYDLQWYPFDIQNCQLQLTMFGKSGDFATLEAEIINFFGKKSIKEFVVESYSMKISENNGQTTLKMNIILGRNLLPIALNTYLPSILLIIISYVTIFFKPFFFEAIVTVNLTTLLVLVTLFVSVSSSLPPTSYMKMVDIYLIFCLIIPFAEVLLITYMDYLRMSTESHPHQESENEEKTQRTINHHGHVIKVNDDDHDVTAASPEPLFVRRNDVPRSVGDILRKFRKIEVETLGSLYSHARKKGTLITYCKRFAVYGIPVLIIMFLAPYIIVGFLHVNQARKEAEQRN